MASARERPAPRIATAAYSSFALSPALYNRELALFYTDHDLKLPEALELARRELRGRRDVYTHDVLARARYENGRAGEALEPLAEALWLGTRDARRLVHAGMNSPCPAALVVLLGALSMRRGASAWS